MSLDVAVDDEASAALLRAGAALRLDLADAATAMAGAMLQVAREEASGGMVARRTGAYLAGLSTTVDAARDGVVAILQAAAPQSVILEYGATLPAEDIMASAGHVLRFDGSAGDVYARAVHFPGAVIAPRPVLHTALSVLALEIADVMTDAGERFVRNAT